MEIAAVNIDPSLIRRIEAELSGSGVHLNVIPAADLGSGITGKREPRILIISATPENDDIAEQAQQSGFFVLAVVEPERAATATTFDFPADDFLFVPVTAMELQCRLRAISRTVVSHTKQAVALAESEGIAAAILQETVDGMITINDRGMILSFNRAAEDIFGYHRDEIIGKNVSTLMPEPYRSEHNGYLKSYRQTGQRKIIGIGREVIGLRKDQSTFPMELAVGEVDLPDRKLFAGIVRDVSIRRRLEREILHISEQERRRIGQDLHDGLGQMLSGIAMLSEGHTQKLKREDHPFTVDAEKITSLIGEADEYARLLARGLVPVQLEANGLETALKRLAVQAHRIFRIECNVTARGIMPHHTDTVAVHLYRIAQEAVSNAVKHGKADVVNIQLAIGEDHIRLRIHDNGIGFPKKLGPDRGMGVYIMHHRARIINANLDIHAAENGGTVIMCTIPIKSSHADTTS